MTLTSGQMSIHKISERDGFEYRECGIEVKKNRPLKRNLLRRTIMEEINYVKMAAYFGAAIAMGIGGLGPSLGQGIVAAKAVETMGKYPEMSTKIRTTMFLALGIIETSSIYAFVVAMMLIIGS